jgi:hypothetical protein
MRFPDGFIFSGSMPFHRVALSSATLLSVLPGLTLTNHIPIFTPVSARVGRADLLEALLQCRGVRSASLRKC